MANRSAVLAIKILGDASSAERAMRDTDRAASSTTGRVSSGFKRMAATIGAAFALDKVTEFLGDTIKAASDLQQNVGGAQAVFGKYSDAVVAASKKAADAYGLSSNQYLESSNKIGALLHGQGVSQDKLAGSTDALIKKASDMAATFGGTTADAVEALTSAFKGETDPIERYGVSIKAADIKAQEAAAGTDKLTGKAAKLAQQQAVLALINKQTAASTGQFAAQTNSLAEQQQIVSAKFDNVKATIGAVLLPILTKLFSFLSGTLIPIITKIIAWLKDHAKLIGLVALAISPLIAAWAAYAAITKVVAIAQAALNLVMEANPIVLVVTAIVALVAALVLAYKKSKTFRDIVQAAFHAVAKIVGGVVHFFTHDVVDAFMAVWHGLKDAWDKVVSFLKTWGPRALWVLAPFIKIPLFIKDHFGEIVAWFRGIWDDVVSGVRGFVSKFVDIFVGVKDRIADVVHGIVDFFRDLPGNLLDFVGRLGDAAERLLGAFWDGIKKAASAAWGAVQDIAKSIVNGIIQGLNSILGLPWTIHIHIPLPVVPDVDFGPYTVLPRIPLWSAAELPAVAQLPDLDKLTPGFTLLADSPHWQTAQVTLPPTSSQANQLVHVEAKFYGLVTDPDGVARQIEQLLNRRAVRIGASR